MRCKNVHRKFFSNFFNEYISLPIAEEWTGILKIALVEGKKTVKNHNNVILIEELSNI